MAYAFGSVMPQTDIVARLVGEKTVSIVGARGKSICLFIITKGNPDEGNNPKTFSNGEWRVEP